MGCLLSILRHSKSSLKRYFPRRRSTPVFFQGSARRQYFDLPDPIMYYIAKNASNAALYRKLVYSCKYFFIKRPLIVIPCLHESKDGWSTCLIDKKKDFEKFDMEKISTKLWLCDRFVNYCDEIKQSDASFTPTPLKMLIPKFYRIESRGIRMKDSTLTMEELVFFASRSAKHLHLRNCIVQYENGEPVQLDTLIAQFPLLVNFIYDCHPDGSNISANTAKEILSNPDFSKMKVFNLRQIPDNFDVESLLEYLKSRDDFFCQLHFRSDISADYRDRVEAIIEELLSTELTSFPFPSIRIPNMHLDTYNAMNQRFEEDCKRHNMTIVP